MPASDFRGGFCTFSFSRGVIFLQRRARQAARLGRGGGEVGPGPLGPRPFSFFCLFCFSRAWSWAQCGCAVERVLGPESRSWPTWPSFPVFLFFFFFLFLFNSKF